MTPPSPEIPEPNPLGCAGITALLFAASPTCSLVLVSMAEAQQRHTQSQSGPVGVGVPSIWYIWLILLGLSLPWIIAGGMLLRRIPAARWIALVLTLPTALLTVLACAGTIAGMNAPRDSVTATNTSAFGPIASAGLLFCLTVWITECAGRPGNQPTATSPPSEDAS